MKLLLLCLLLGGSVADIPVLRDSNPNITGAVNLKSLPLTGQSTCAMVLSGSGSATITPMGSSDGGATYNPVSAIGVQTTNGTYGGTIAPYLSNFFVAVTSVSGTVRVDEACSAAITVPV